MGLGAVYAHAPHAGDEAPSGGDAGVVHVRSELVSKCVLLVLQGGDPLLERGDGCLEALVLGLELGDLELPSLERGDRGVQALVVGLELGDLRLQGLLGGREFLDLLDGRDLAGDRALLLVFILGLFGSVRKKQ